jgi:hypothetical protein
MEEQAAPERTESPKQRKVKTGVNLRKSLVKDNRDAEAMGGTPLPFLGCGDAC